MSSVNLGIGLGLVWLVSTTLDSYYPDLNLFAHIFLSVFISSGILSLISGFISNTLENHKFFKKHEDQINKMIESGMSITDVSAKLKEMKDAELSSVHETEPFKTSDIKIVATTETCGYYNNTDIYQKIKMSDGSIYEFDGIIDLDKKVNLSMLNNSCIVTSAGIIYKLIK